MSIFTNALASPAHSGTTWLRLQRWLPWLVLAVTLLITWQLWRDAKQNAVQELQSNFDFRVHEVDGLVKQRMMAYEQVLRGVVGLFASSRSVKRNEFHDFVSTLRLEKNFPGIQGISFAPVVPAAEKSRHVAAVRKEGFLEYTIKPEGEREIYAPVIYIEPYSGLNLRVPGFDNYSNSERRGVVDMARDSDDAVITGKIKLMQETDKDIQAGCLMFMPVYKNGRPHDTLAERHANIFGWVASSFRMNDLMRGTLGARSSDLDIDIYDGEKISAQALMYDDDNIRSRGGNSVSRFQSINRVEIAGHFWTMVVSSSPAFEAQLEGGKSRFIGYTGIGTGILLALLTWLLVRGRRRAMQAAQAISERQAEMRIAATAFESQEAMIITNAKGVILRVNKAFTDTTGYTSEEALGQTPRLLKSGRHNADFYLAMWEAIHRTGTWQGEIWDRRKNGEVYPKWLSITAVKGDDGAITHYVGSHIDITDIKAAEEEIKTLAFYDPLTRLPNRRLLIDRLQHALASSTRSGREGALLFIDLDNFKTINDTHGHDIGDLLLQQVAQRLESCVREGDTVARLGGDEFVVMLEDLSEKDLDSAAQTEAVGEKILATLGQPYLLGAHEYHSTPSIGATIFKDHGQSQEDLLKQADIAMYQAKNAGRNNLRFFNPQMQEIINSRAALEKELRKALEKQQFQLHYQVQMDSSYCPLGAEVLIRWLHPDRGLVSPMQFIPLAEETGLILPIGQWVLETACIQLKAWEQNELTRDLVLSVNVSAKQFRKVDFVAQVQSLVQRYAVNPQLLKIELTESMLLDSIEDIIATMNALKEFGIQFSLDDFGTGYSSLQYLKRLPLGQLKIDRSFVRDIAIDSSDKVIVSTIIAMAQSLGLDAIAEGVETEEQRLFLLDAGCTHYQGYLFGKPMPIDQFEASLKQD